IFENDESTVADHDLYLLLQDWNLKHLYNHFIDHHITIKVLKILKPKHIDMLFYGLPIGDMVTFEDEFEKWKKTHIDERIKYNTGKRGKLYNKIFNLKRLSKGIFKSEEEPDTNLRDELVPEKDSSFAIQILRSGHYSNDEMDLYWRKCYQCRFKQIKESKSTSEILKLWPEYIKPSGYTLIDIDFGLKYPQAKDMKTKWVLTESKLLHLLQSKVPNVTVSKMLTNLKSCDSESRIFSILYCLHYLFPPQQKVVTDKAGAKIRKKFTVTASQDSFAIVAETKEELDMKLKLLKLQKCNIQPRLLILGEIANVKEIFVYFDEIKYPMVQIITAVDILFKIFFVFNLEFPIESDLFYNFMQQFFYEINSEKKYSKVFTVINEILNLKE
ncbi:hypothetical protein CVS40_12277, partial [Lucilia cuprina]